MHTNSVKIFVITHKRPVLLKRALRSLINQLHQNWTAEVLNDEPSDLRVNKLIEDLGDERIAITATPKKRGGTGNFNYAFAKNVTEKFACILEDDNWFEPDFLTEMLESLEKHPKAKLAVANENIWQEKPNGEWEDLKKTIWPTDVKRYLLEFNAEQKCLGAKICNSAMFWRTGDFTWLTPTEIPIDVTEHFRERIIPHPILIIPKPLVNFAVTSRTYRVANGDWSVYQALLIASVFENISSDARDQLAKNLWLRARQEDQHLQTALLNAAFVCKSARVLFRHALAKERVRYLLTILRRFKTFLICTRATQTKSESWRFLLTNWNSETHS